MDPQPPLDQLSPPCSITEPDQDHFLDLHAPSHATGSPGKASASDWSVRFTSLAHRVARNAVAIPTKHSLALHHHLDCIESLLPGEDDPRPAFTREVAACRPAPPASSSGGRRVGPDSASSTMSPASPTSPTSSSQHTLLKNLLEETTALNAEIQQRRSEATLIYDQFLSERRHLAHQVSTLENEIHLLHRDIEQDTSEREALYGTVQGLDRWLATWQSHNDHILARKVRPSQPHRWAKRKTPKPLPHENEIESLLDGMTAWMRGWSDLEEGFRARETSRRVGIDERQRMRMRMVGGGH